MVHDILKDIEAMKMIDIRTAGRGLHDFGMETASNSNVEGTPSTKLTPSGRRVSDDIECAQQLLAVGDTLGIDVDDTTIRTETSLNDAADTVDDPFLDRTAMDPFKPPSSRSVSDSLLIKKFIVSNSRKPHRFQLRRGTMGTAITADSDDTFRNRMDTLPYTFDFVEPSETPAVTGINALAAEFAADRDDRISPTDPTRTTTSNLVTHLNLGEY